MGEQVGEDYLKLSCDGFVYVAKKVLAGVVFMQGFLLLVELPDVIEEHHEG